MERHDVRTFNAGVNQSGVRDYNERLLLTMIQKLGPLPGSDIARQASLSAQTVSVILRSLEADGLLVKGEPQRGRVGKPRIPMKLNPEGSFSIGLKVGRRSADLALMDLIGNVRMQRQLFYRYPDPLKLVDFLHNGLDEMTDSLPEHLRERLCGIGIAAPSELWKRNRFINVEDRALDAWHDVSIAEQVSKFTELPVSFVNDATSACYAENTFGRGVGYRDFAYFFIGAFAGGGVAMNGAVFEGHRGNAGALGSVIIRDEKGRFVQLMDKASIAQLESAISLAGGNPTELWAHGADWSIFEAQLGPWIEMASEELAMAAITCCAIIDFEAVVIDGAFPAAVRARLVKRTVEKARAIETIGLLRPEIIEGSVGANARVLGAAYRPIATQYFLGNNGLNAYL
ncbi:MULTISPECIES: ROK family protein [unclassified Marinovum]